MTLERPPARCHTITISASHAAGIVRHSIHTSCTVLPLEGVAVLNCFSLPRRPPRPGERIAALQQHGGMPMDVVAVSTPPENAWRWRIVNYAGEVVEESHETFTTIAAALASGAVRLPAIDVANRR